MERLTKILNLLNIHLITILESIIYNCHWKAKKANYRERAQTGDDQNRVLVHWDGSAWRKLLTTNEKEHLYWGWLDDLDQLWVIKDETIYKIDRNGREHPVKKEQVLIGTITSVYVEPNGIFWISTYQGVARYTPSIWRIPAVFTDMKIYEIHEDKKKRMWFKSNNSLVQFKDDQLTFYPISESIHAEGIYNQFINGMLSLPDGRIVIQSINGLVLFNPVKKKFNIVNHPEQRIITNITQLRDGRILTVTYRSDVELWEDYQFEIFDGNKFKFFCARDDLKIGKIPCVFEAENGDLWFSANDGITRYSDGEYKRFGPEDGYHGPGARCILEVETGKFWFGSYDKIYEFDGDHWRIVREHLNEPEYMIKSRDGSIWVTTGSGLLRYSDGSWVENTFEDGLPNVGLLNMIEDSQGRIWVLSKNCEIRLYDPYADPDPPISIIDPMNLSTFTEGGDAQFAYWGQDKWKYTHPNRLLYSHRIDEEEWSPFTSNIVASVTSLTVGMHLFQVRAMDRNWNVSQSVPFDFTVHWRWYRDPLFLITFTVGLALIVFFAFLAVKNYRHVLVSNTQLKQANEELRELDKMKSAFVSQASHDLRTPLTAIKSSMDNILRGVGGNPNEKHQKLIDRALRSVERLTHLINDVLDINRIESGRMVLEKSDIHFEALVKNVIQENQPAVEQKKISLKADGLNGPYPINVDAGKIERIVGELISNAIKYTPEGGNVEVNLRKEDNHVVLSVIDSGIGMTKEECEKIWERFYRTMASQKFAKGSGLGLSIAKELVEMHNGSLTVESEQGFGSTFTMMLPV